MLLGGRKSVYCRNIKLRQAVSHKSSPFCPKKHCFAYRSQKSQNQKKFRDAVLGDEQAAGKGAVKKRRKKDEGDALPKVSRVEVEEVGCHHLQLVII